MNVHAAGRLTIRRPDPSWNDLAVVRVRGTNLRHLNGTNVEVTNRKVAAQCLRRA
jgi:hypothetical protein